MLHLVRTLESYVVRMPYLDIRNKIKGFMPHNQTIIFYLAILPTKYLKIKVKTPQS